jgi:hypothetical protein
MLARALYTSLPLRFLREVTEIREIVCTSGSLNVTCMNVQTSSLLKQIQTSFSVASFVFSIVLKYSTQAVSTVGLFAGNVYHISKDKF